MVRVSHIDIGGRRSTHKRHKKFKRVTLKSFHIQPLLISGIKFGSKRQKSKCVINNATQIDKMYRGSNNCIYVISIMFFFLTLKLISFILYSRVLWICSLINTLPILFYLVIWSALNTLNTEDIKLIFPLNWDVIDWWK